MTEVEIFINALGPYIIPLIILHVACGGFCMSLAKAKNLPTSDWFILGVIFSLIALIAIAGMPIKNNHDKAAD